MTKQITLKDSFSLQGKGLHTGLEINLTVKPGKENSGYVIRRMDLEGTPEIPALAEYVVETQRGTVLKKGEAQVSTVEHCLADLYSAGIDNCIIEIDAPEVPILDGSAAPYCEKISEVGVVEQSAEKNYFIVNKKISYKSEDGKTQIEILPDDSFSAQVLIGYDSPILSNQFAILDNMNDFAKEIAPCRTFVFVRELVPLLKMNLIKGGDLNNALVIYDKQVTDEELKQIAQATQHDGEIKNELGYLSNGLKFDNEPARHKLMDLLGDLSLIGRPIKGRVIATHPGHTANTAFAKILRKDIKRQEVFAPVYNDDSKVLLDINRIKELLPHRYPFLLVDKVMEISETSIVAIKNITFNEMQFLGHFPEEPVMPGVLQVEAMAQAAGLLVLSQVDEPEKYSTYFLKIDNVKFRQKVVPGDVMVMKVSLTTPIRRGLAAIKGYVFINGKIATEAEMTAQIVKNK